MKYNGKIKKIVKNGQLYPGMLEMFVGFHNKPKLIHITEPCLGEGKKTGVFDFPFELGVAVVCNDCQAKEF